MAVTVEQIKKLREETGVSLGLCKTVLEEANGDHSKAIAILKDKGVANADKKAGRSLGAGTVSAYIHNTKDMGAMVELDSETDFVAKNAEFQALAYDIAMQVMVTMPENIETLLEQPFIKDETKKVRELILTATQKFGERIEIRNFSRFSTKE